MNRRQFLFASASGALLRAPHAATSKKYDLVIKGGRVIDPSRKLDTMRDVAIADGRIAAIASNISAEGAETTDARAAAAADFINELFGIAA